MGRIYDATWGRGFAALYDSCFKAVEEAGLRDMRRQLVGQAKGRTIDIGSGTGANLELYPREVELVMTEPDPHMARQLRRKLGEADREVEFVQAGAEDLPFEDASFDSAVFTLVLCTVPNQRAALVEVSRVLKPGGRMLFLEHVRSESPKLARWQDRLEKPWRFIGDGCHCNRDTVAAIEASPLVIEQVEHDRLPKAPPITRPLARGSAIRAAA
ncbi:MAG TPA: class I SAM-dependent methyltransferase [Solirubrobacterales bacterium]|nr:class I SAM-dependent methyltransferase [Solirubrobacterales bacterium]